MDAGTVVSIVGIVLTVFLFVLGLLVHSFKSRYVQDQRTNEIHRIEMKDSITRVETQTTAAHERMDNISMAVTRQWAETIEEVHKKEGRMQAQISEVDKKASVLKARCDTMHHDERRT